MSIRQLPILVHVHIIVLVLPVVLQHCCFSCSCSYYFTFCFRTQIESLFLTSLLYFTLSWAPFIIVPFSLKLVHRFFPALHWLFLHWPTLHIHLHQLFLLYSSSFSARPYLYKTHIIIPCTLGAMFVILILLWRIRSGNCPFVWHQHHRSILISVTAILAILIFLKILIVSIAYSMANPIWNYNTKCCKRDCLLPIAEKVGNRGNDVSASYIRWRIGPKSLENIIRIVRTNVISCNNLECHPWR